MAYPPSRQLGYLRYAPVPSLDDQHGKIYDCSGFVLARGDPVILSGLTGRTDLNGSIGKVARTASETENGRIGVRLGGAAPLAIKCENVQYCYRTAKGDATALADTSLDTLGAFLRCGLDTARKLQVHARMRLRAYLAHIGTRPVNIWMTRELMSTVVRGQRLSPPDEHGSRRGRLHRGDRPRAMGPLASLPARVAALLRRFRG